MRRAHRLMVAAGVAALVCVPLASASPAARPPATLRLVCDGHFDKALTSTVAVQRDGLHVEVENVSSTPLAIAIYSSTGGERGGDAARGVSNRVFALAPALIRVGCYDAYHQDASRLRSVWPEVSVVDPHGFYVPERVSPTCPGSTSVLLLDYMPEARGEHGDPASVVREMLRAQGLLKPGDTVERAGYPVAAMPKARLVRHGQIIAVVKLIPDHHGGWLESSLEQCTSRPRPSPSTSRAHPARGSGTPCWKRLINDWYDGRIDRAYPVSCYRQALRMLPAGLPQTPLLFADLHRALAHARNGIVPAGQSGRATTPSSEVAALTNARSGELEWRKALQIAARTDPTTRFPSPPKAVLLARLRQAQQRFGFTVVRVELLRPRQLAPIVVIRTNDKQAIARATATIFALLDPHQVTATNPSGSAYEGFFFEAQDEHGTPFLTAFYHERCCPPGGGEWASDPALYPFGHG